MSTVEVVSPLLGTFTAVYGTPCEVVLAAVAVGRPPVDRSLTCNRMSMYNKRVTRMRKTERVRVKSHH